MDAGAVLDNLAGLLTVSSDDLGTFTWLFPASWRLVCPAPEGERGGRFLLRAAVRVGRFSGALEEVTLGISLPRGWRPAWLWAVKLRRVYSCNLQSLGIF